MKKTQSILMSNNVFSLFLNANHSEQFKNNSFSGLQTFFRIVFKYGLISNKTREKLIKHYGSEEVALQKTISVYKILSSYENSVISYKLIGKSSPNSVIRKFEKEMSIFGLSANDLRSSDFIPEIKKSIYLSSL